MLNSCTMSQLRRCAYSGVEKLACTNLICFSPTIPQPASGVRHFSSEPKTNVDFLCSNKTRKFLDSLCVNTRDFQQDAGSNDKLKALILAAEQAADKDYDMKNLKSLYHDVVRPELVSRFLVHSFPLGHNNTQWLSYQIHGRTKRKTRFITCFDVMIHLQGLAKQFWTFFLNYLLDESIIVVEEWKSISTVQHLVYDHGLKDLGSGIHFFKGECDAALHQLKKPPVADLSSIIWDDDQVISSQTYQGVPCKDIQEAEAQSAFAMLNRAKELLLENLVMWTDNELVAGVLQGTRPVDLQCQDWKLHMALKSMRTSFRTLVVLKVPREVMVFSDGMLRRAGVKYPRFQMAAEWDYFLNGLPTFRVAQTEVGTKIMNRFAKPINGERRAGKYYVNVKAEKKISALLNLRRALAASTLYVAVHNVKSKPEDIQKDLKEITGDHVVSEKGMWSVFASHQGDSTSGSVLVMFDGLGPKNLVKNLVKNCGVGLTVILVSTDEDCKALEKVGGKELSASALFHFKGVLPPT